MPDVPVGALSGVYWFCRSKPDRLSPLPCVYAFLPKQQELIADGMNRHKHRDSERDGWPTAS